MILRFFQQQSLGSYEVSVDPVKVPTTTCTHPGVFLKPLSEACAALTPPLRSVLRIEVKQPLSEGKLESKKGRQKERNNERRAK